jgi:hypothetical protein
VLRPRRSLRRIVARMLRRIRYRARGLFPYDPKQDERGKHSAESSRMLRDVPPDEFGRGGRIVHPALCRRFFGIVVRERLFGI